jgi:GT2 family glycosyltransferase
VDVRVCIPTHDRRELVVRLVRSLIGDCPLFDVVVVCDGCTDGSEDALRRESSAITVISQPASGPGAARNRAAEGATASTLLFLDDDMRAEPGLVARHLDAQRRIGGGIVLGAMPVDPASPPSFLTQGLSRWAEGRDARLRSSPPRFDDVLTGNLSISRDAFQRLSGFDAAFTRGDAFGDEDLELGWRAVASGIALAYEPLAVAFQTFDKTFVRLARDIRRGAAADLRFVAKHPEAREHLMLGRLDRLPPWERRAATLPPAVARMLLAPAVVAMEGLRILGARGKKIEEAHAVVRAGLYGLGLSATS